MGGVGIMKEEESRMASVKTSGKGCGKDKDGFTSFDLDLKWHLSPER